MSVEINVTNEVVEINEVSEIVEIVVSGGIGPAGPQGPAGQGVPIGGTTGQVLGKLSSTNYDTAWISNGVPYTGATTNVDLGEFELKAGQVEFDQTPTGTAGVGVMRWNDTDGTVDLGLKGGNVTLQVGQEQVLRVVNKSGVNLTEAGYQVVKVLGAQGQRLSVTLAQANNDAGSAETLGIVTENININQEGFITTSGLVRGIDTRGVLQGETWAEGDMLYLSGTTAGALTKVKPIAPIHSVVVGYVISSAPNGSIFVKVTNGQELDELHNVAIVSVANNEALIYESATSLWKNKTIATALGYTPQAALTLTTTGTSGAATLVGATLNIPQYSGTNIYNADGTLTGDRTVSIADKKLIFQSTAPTTNYTFTLGTPTGVTASSWPANFIKQGEFNIATLSTAEIEATKYWGRNQTGSSKGLLVNQVIADVTGESTGAIYCVNQAFATYRGSSLDTTTGGTSYLIGTRNFIGHAYPTTGAATTTQIISSFVTALDNVIYNTVGTITNAYAINTTLNVAHTTSTQNSVITNFYGHYISVSVGTTSGPTGLITNFYGLYLATPTVNATGTITNRWGIYAPDVAMPHYLNGNLLVGTNANSTYKLDVNGTARVSGELRSQDSGGGFIRLVGGTSESVIEAITSGAGQANIRTYSSFILGSGTNLYLSVGNSGSSFFNSTQIVDSITGNPNKLYFNISSTGGIIGAAQTAVADRPIYISPYSKQVAIGISSGINNSASLQVESTTKGFLPPRMTNAQRTAIATPAVGLIVYCTDSVEGVYVYTSLGWKSLTMV